MNRLKVKEQPFLIRDVQSNGILNTNEAEYNDYVKRKRMLRMMEEEKINTEDRLNKIESEVSELKEGINQILELLKK